MSQNKDEYTKQVKKRFLNPKHMGEMKDADAIGQITNPVCKDTMKVYLKINPENGKIIDAKFQTIGCAAAISSSDATCELVIGKTLADARKITRKEILGLLGGLPKIKEHCSLLGEKAVRIAIKNYKLKKEK